MTLTEAEAAGVQRFTRTRFRCFTPPPSLDVNEWANEYRYLSRVANSRGGRWKSRCFQREIQREMTNPDVRSIVFVAAAQTGGKSELILNFFGRQIHLNPGPMMLVQPTNELAERFSKKRVQPMIKDTPVLSPLCGSMKSRDGNNTIRQKTFPGGALNIAGANTPNELCSDPIRDVAVDEVDRCQQSAGKEGDIVVLAEARQEDFHDAFSLFTSTPSGSKPRPAGEMQPPNVSKIMVLFAESDQRYWYCPCQACGRMQTLRWENVDFGDSKIGTRDDPRLLCEDPACRYAHTDSERVKMIEAGEWRAMAPFASRRGYHLNGIYSLSRPQRGSKTKLQQMVKAFLRAKSRGVEALRAWVNTFLCECFEEDGSESVEPMPLYSRREKYGKHVPAGVAILTAGMDIHPHRIEIQVVGWGAEEECWPVEYKVFHGNTEKQQVWDEADRFLQIEYEHANGHKIAVERFCVDTRHKTDEAIAFCQARILRGAIPIKGIDGHGLPVMNLPRKTGIRKTRCWLVSKATSWKTLYARLKLTTPGPGYIHFPSDREPEFDIEYFKQLTAAEVTTFTRGGLELQNFDAGSRRDEAADTWRYALGALRRFTEDMGKRLYKLRPRTPEVEEEQEEELGCVVKGRGFEV